MSDLRYTAIFGGALLTAGAATFAVYRMLGAAATPTHEPVRAVVVAVRDVPAGVAVPREALGIASWPVRVAPSESYGSADSIVGRVTRVPLMSGEPVLTTRLAARGAAPGLEGTIDPTRRAMAVRVNEAASVSGLVRSNSRVDVLMAGRADGGTQPTARVLMSDVRVLGVGSVRPPEPAGGSGTDASASSSATAAIVTLEVTPAQAELLAAAESQGAIQVVLRGYGSVGTTVASSLDGARSGLGETGPAYAGVVVPRGMGAAGGFGAGAPTVVPSRDPVPPTPARSAPRHARGAGGPAVAEFGRQAADSTGARAHAEPAVIQVYRGGVMTTLRVDAAGAPAASGAAAPPARTVRVADTHAGTTP